MKGPMLPCLLTILGPFVACAGRPSTSNPSPPAADQQRTDTARPAPRLALPQEEEKSQSVVERRTTQRKHDSEDPEPDGAGPPKCAFEATIPDAHPRQVSAVQSLVRLRLEEPRRLWAAVLSLEVTNGQPAGALRIAKLCSEETLAHGENLALDLEAGDYWRSLGSTRISSRTCRRSLISVPHQWG